MRAGSRTYRVVIALVALGSLALFVRLALTRPQPGRRPGNAVAPVVEVVEAQPSAVPVKVQAMGGVQPAQTVRVLPQVSGKVVHVSPRLIPGGQVQKGQILVQVDPQDYELAIRVAQGEVAQAQLAVDVQLGQRAAARRELELVGGNLVPTQEGLRLASRQSYLDSAQAQLDAARSRLEQAQLALARTALRAPFDARVQERSVDVGQVVSPQSPVAILYASDEVWVVADLPTEQLRWIDVPGLNAEQGAAVTVRQQLEDQVAVERQGQVLGLLPSLTERGKLARVLIGVRRPFGDDADAAASQPAALADAAVSPARRHGPDDAPLPLLVGAFVHLEILGRPLPDLRALPRVALREGNRLWVREAAGTLAVRPAEVVWRDHETVYVRATVASDERVIVSHLASPVPGMRVDLPGATSRPSADAPSGRGQRPELGLREPAAGASQR